MLICYNLDPRVSTLCKIQRFHIQLPICGGLVIVQVTRTILSFWYRRLHGSTLEEVIDSVFVKTPNKSPEVQMHKKALLRSCAVALIKVLPEYLNVVVRIGPVPLLD